jgi:superfamily II DNA or RNA helicase
MALSLREHQQEALDPLEAALNGGADRATVEMATGTGKSYTQAELIERFIDKGPCVAFVPSEQLLVQNAAAYKRWAAETGRPQPFILGVFSGEKTDALDAVTTDPTAIRRHLDRSRATGRPTIVVSTYQSTNALEAAQPEPFALLVADEAHRMASGADEGADGLWKKPLYDAHIPATKRAFFTATLRPDGAMDVESNAVAMNNPELFGRVVHSLGYAEARDRGLLAPIEPEAITLEAADIEVAMEEGGFGRTEDETDGAFRARRRTFAAALMLAPVVERARADNGRASVLAMCPAGNNGGHADALASEGRKNLAGLGLTNVLSVHGKSPEGNEQQAVAFGKDPVAESVTTVIDKLREGTDMPALNALVMARAAQSSTVVIQALGRIARLHPEEWNAAPKKARAYVPIIVDAREGGKVVDGEIAANFVSAFLRLDSNALRDYQNAQQKDGHDLARAAAAKGEGQDLLDDPQKATAGTLAALLKMDTGTAAGRSLAASIARELSANDGIGQTHRMMGRYLAYRAAGGEAEPACPKRRADDPERFDLANWQRSATHAYQRGALSREEEALLETTEGFVLRTASNPDALRGCVARFTAVHGRMPNAQDEGAAGQLHRETAALARRMATNKPSRVEGGAELDRMANAWWDEARAKHAAPLWVSAKGQEATFKTTGRFHRDPDNSQRWLFVPETGAPWMDSGVTTPKDKRMPAIPVHTTPTTERILSTLGSAKIQVGFERTLDAGGTAVFYHPTAESLRIARVTAPIQGGADTPPSVHAKHIRAVLDATHQRGWPCPGSHGDLPAPLKHVKVPMPRGEAPLTLETAGKLVHNIREDHLAGKVNVASGKLLDATPGFQWVVDQDWSRTVTVQGAKRNAAVLALEKVRARNPDSWGKLDAMAQDTALGHAMVQAFRIASNERILRTRIASGEELGEVERKKAAKLRAIVSENPALFQAICPPGQEHAPVRQQMKTIAQQARDTETQKKQKLLEAHR